MVALSMCESNVNNLLIDYRTVMYTYMHLYKFTRSINCLTLMHNHKVRLRTILCID